MDDLPALIGFLESVHPYDSLPHDELARVASLFRRSDLPAETLIYTIGATLEGLYLIQSGEISILDASGAQVSALGPRNSFGARTGRSVAR